MLDAESEGLLEVNRIEDMVSVDVGPAEPPDVFIDTCVSVKRVREVALGCPGSVEIVLGASAVQ